MRAQYRLTHAAQADIVSILRWSDEQFGQEARRRYEALIATALRDAAAADEGDVGRHARPEFGEGVFSWHLAHSRANSPGGKVHRPRHFLICRCEADVLVVARVLHDAMELRRHLEAEQTRE